MRNKIIKLAFGNPKLFLTKCTRRLIENLSDKTYLEIWYRMRIGSKLNLENPQSFNEKLQWLKLYDHKPIYTTMVDKYAVKKYVSNIIGEEYIIPTLGVWDNPEEIEWNKLPNQFVLKVNHDSGGLVICRDKSVFDISSAKKKLRKALLKDYFKGSREWPYKDVPKRILAETYMEDNETKELRDYKFFCFDGVCKAMFIAKDRQNREEPYFDFFDAGGKHLPIKQGHPNAPIPPNIPKGFDEMKVLAERLAKDIPQARVDFYEVNGKVYFGEITLFHFSGLTPFEPEEWDYKFGSWIKLPDKSL